MDREVLHSRKVATYRRLASLSILSNAFWLALTIVGFIVSTLTHDTTRLVSLVILGTFFAIGFRALILGSLFYPKPRDAIPLAFVQPALLFAPAAFSFNIASFGFFTQSPNPIAAVIGGFLTIIAIEEYISHIDSIKVGTYKPFSMLQAFLNAWAAEDATNLERILDATSKEAVVRSELLVLSSLHKDAGYMNALIVVPGIHPGPFYPIGSSNIPADIFQRLSSPTEVPMVVHSMSDHDLNLPSKKQVERYVESLKSQRDLTDSGATASKPVVKQVGKATVCGIRFGATLLITISQAPHGMEDFPGEVRREIENYAFESYGFLNVLVVDTHNSEGEKPNEKECQDAIGAAKEAIDELKNAKQYEFDIGMAHSSELKMWIEADVGPAGVGLILFDVKGPFQHDKFSLVIVDADNSLVGFREKVFQQFESKNGSKILELCTSDTHVTAAKTSDAKGYLALGDVIGPEKFVSILSSLFDRASSRVGAGSFSSFVVESNVKTIGSEVLSNFSGLVDTATVEAKNGAQILGAIAFVITLIVAFI